MEPVTLAIATPAVPQLRIEVAKGAATEFAKSAAGQAGQSPRGAIQSAFARDQDTSAQSVTARPATAATRSADSQ